MARDTNFCIFATWNPPCVRDKDTAVLSQEFWLSLTGKHNTCHHINYLLRFLNIRGEKNREVKEEVYFILHIAENILEVLLFSLSCWNICIFPPLQRCWKAGVLQPEILSVSVHEEWMETGKNCFCSHHCVCLVLVSICLCHLNCLGRVSGRAIQTAGVKQIRLVLSSTWGISPFWMGLK